MWYPVRTGLAALALLAACGDGSGGVTQPDPLVVEVRGALVRDSVVHVSVKKGAAARAGATLTASPADAIELLGGDSLRFLKTGAVMLTAAADGSTGSKVVTVAAPPPLGVEVTGRMERGSVVQVRVLLAGVALAPGAAALTFSPADAGQSLGGDSVKLLRAGTVTVRATAGRDEGTRDLAVAAPPSVVFDRVVDGNRDLWRVALDGGDLVRLTDDPSDDTDPTVAAGRIVFVSFRADRNNELWSMPVAGGPAARLTRTGRNETMPALSRDGQRLAFIYDITGLPKLWTSAGDGTGAARASATFGGNFAIDASPSWAPDGSRIAFTSTAEGSADIFSIAPPSAPALLAGGGSTDVDAAFSPDGRFLAFSSDRTGGTDLYLMALSSGIVTRLTSSASSEGQATWTSDGRLVFTEFGSAGGQLRYVDLAAPTVIRAIATGPGSARNPAGIP